MTNIGDGYTRTSPPGPKIAEPSPYTESLHREEDAHSPDASSYSTSPGSADSPSDPVFSTPLRSGDSPSQPSTSPTDNGQDETKTASQGETVESMRCIFTENCDTGAQLRKAISHFFGRNKSCTLKIPPHVWVYYCRKHYQRIRCRNSKDYGLIQIDLVRMQVEMLQGWSQKNQESGHGRYIRDWTLALRKREQERLEELGPSAARTSTAPKWVFDSLGSGYTFEQILGMVDRFRSELADKTLEDIPEVEFLPDIVGGGNEGKSKNTKSRKQNKRKASQTNTDQQADCLGDNDVFTSPPWDSSMMGLQRGKRARLDNPEFLHDRSLNSSDSIRLPPKMYADPTHATGFGGHSGFKDQTQFVQELNLPRGFVAPVPQRIDPALLNTIADRPPGRAMDQNPVQALENTSMRARDLTQAHAGQFPKEIRNDSLDKLPPLTSYRPYGSASPDRHLPPISTRYDGMAFNTHRIPSEQSRFSDVDFPHQHHPTIFGRSSTAVASGTTHQRWHSAGSLDSQSPGDPHFTNDQRLFAPSRFPYQVNHPDSQISQVHRYGVYDQTFRNDLFQSGHQYHGQDIGRYDGEHVVRHNEPDIGRNHGVKGGFPTSHEPVPNAFATTRAPLATMGSSSSGSQGSTPRADDLA